MATAAWSAALAGEHGAQRWQRAALAADAAINGFVEVDATRPARGAKGAAGANGGHAEERGAVLAGVPFAVKDNIAVEGFSLSCGSRLLRGLVAPYTATAVARLQGAGARVVGKTNLDEFGMARRANTPASARCAIPGTMR